MGREYRELLGVGKKWVKAYLESYSVEDFNGAWRELNNCERYLRELDEKTQTRRAYLNRLRGILGLYLLKKFGNELYDTRKCEQCGNVIGYSELIDFCSDECSRRYWQFR